MKWNEGGKFEEPKPGSYLARCIWLIDLGTQHHSFGGETWNARDVKIGFELPTTLMTGIYNPEMKGRPFMASTVVKQSLHPSAKLRKMVKSWKGRDLTKEEIAAFDPKLMLGKTCRLGLIESSDGAYINIDSISPLNADEKVPKAINPQVFFSLEANEFKPQVFAALPEGLRKKISESPEYAALVGQGEEPQPEAPSDDQEGPF